MYEFHYAKLKTPNNKKDYILYNSIYIAAAAKSLQLCLTLCDPIDGSPPGSPIPGILQARAQEWVAISFCNAWKWKVKVKSLSHVRLLVTSWTAACQAPPSIGVSRQEYWSGVPLPSPSIYIKSLKGKSVATESRLFVVCLCGWGASLVARLVKKSAYNRLRFDSWVGKIPWRRKWQPTPVFLPGESH